MASASTDTTLTSSNGTAYTLNAYFNENSTSVANNTSNITVRATLSSGNRHWSSSYTSYLRIYWHDNKNNTDVFVAETGATTIANNSSITAQGTINVTHKNDGSLSGYAYATWTMGGTSSYCPQSGSVSNGWTALSNIPRFATITSAPTSLNDESTFWFKYSNPANASMSCWLEVNPNGTHRASHELSGTSGTYTWTLTDTQRNNLRADLANSNSGTIRIGLYSTIGGTTNASYKDVPFSIVNATPIFQDFDYADTNTTVTAITGNDQVLVKGLSNLAITIASADKMVAQKQATPKNYIASIDNTSISANYSTSNVSIDIGTIATSGTKRLNVRAYDSRNNSALVYKDITVYDYEKPIINATAERQNNFENSTTLKVNGSYSLLKINNVNKNQISNIRYRYREQGGSWGSFHGMTYTLSGNSFSCNDVVLTLDNSKKFEIQVQVIDSLGYNYVILNVDIGKSIFFISTNERKCYINNLEVLTKGYQDEYSTTEQKIGTWIDGKPLYRIVYSGKLTSTTNTFEIANSEIINVYGIVRSTYSNWWKFPNVHTEDGYHIYYYLNNSRNRFTLSCGSYYNNTCPYFIIVEYTKTTD